MQLSDQHFQAVTQRVAAQQQHAHDVEMARLQIAAQAQSGQRDRGTE